MCTWKRSWPEGRFSKGAALSEFPGDGKIRFWQRDLGGGDVAGPMSEAGKGQGIVRSAALMIQTQGIGAGESGGDSVVDQERIGDA